MGLQFIHKHVMPSSGYASGLFPLIVSLVWKDSLLCIASWDGDIRHSNSTS